MSQWHTKKFNRVQAVAHVGGPAFAPSHQHHPIESVFIANRPSDPTDAEQQMINLYLSMEGKTYREWLDLK